jgi:hypothetical protein
VCEQTNGKKARKKRSLKESIARMCVYKKNEQNGTNTRIHSMRHKIERERDRQK